MSRYQKGEIVNTLERKSRQFVILDIIQDLNIRYLCQNIQGQYKEMFFESDIRR